MFLRLAVRESGHTLAFASEGLKDLGEKSVRFPWDSTLRAIRLPAFGALRILAKRGSVGPPPDPAKGWQLMMLMLPRVQFW